MTRRNLFVTTALPYANGPLHIGHIMEYIQADIWVRFQRMRGHAVHFVGAEDAHGAPIMIAAEKAGKTPQQFIDEVRATRPRYLDGFLIGFDHWHTTDSPENVELSQAIYRALQAPTTDRYAHDRAVLRPGQGHVPARPLHQGHVPEVRREGSVRRQLRGVRLDLCADRPDRSLLGAVTGARPELRSFRALLLPAFRRALRRVPARLDCGRNRRGEPRLQPEVFAKTQEWLRTGRQGLADWDISRDAPYFGIPIPDAPGKFFYVWLDAPIGYLAALKAYFDSGKARANGEPRSFDDFLAADDVEQIHFIGKDIIYHHTLFWPAMLRFSGRKVPDNIYVHGFDHRQRREDEQEPRHRNRSAALPRTRHESGVVPLLRRGQAQRPRRGRRLQSRRLHAAGQQRPDRQVREHREPRGELSRPAVRRTTGGRRARNAVAVMPSRSPPNRTSRPCSTSGNSARRCAK